MGTGSTAAETLAAALKHYMAARGLTQKELEKLSGVAQTTISLYMRPDARSVTSRGKQGSPTLSNIEALAHALGVQAWELLCPADGAEREFIDGLRSLMARHGGKPTGR